MVNLIKEIEFIPEKYSPVDEELILRAYRAAEVAHRGQKRASGEPYLNHCVAVATILIELNLPPAVVAAGLLHDTVEDTDLTLEDLKKDFGEEIAGLVDGVTKLIQLPRVSRSDQQVSIEDQEEGKRRVAARRGLPDPEEEELARSRNRNADLASETLRKTFLAMGDDIRIVLIKLADRLHNMRTLGYVPEKKRKRIAQQTLDIFAPLASRLGIWQIKWELEDLGFRYSNPDVYKEIAQNFDDKRSIRESQVEIIKKKLDNLLNQNKFKAEISGRPKHLFSIYKKMTRKGVPFELVHDIRAVRIIVKDILACYSVLGLIHTNWRPIPGEFDDYIAAPKDNFYQSLHTAVIFDDGKTLEVQIRTPEMHENAEYGIAAHWLYKEGMKSDESYEKRVVWLRQIMDWMQDVEDAGEFVDSMKTDVFSDRVYAFTPAGDIIDLPTDSTPIDFAYHVHTEVGHRCRGAKVNGILVSLDYILQTGDQVEILTAKRGGPSRDWLNQNLGLLNTHRARSKVRQWFRRQDREQNISIGKSQVEREFNRLGLQKVDLDNLAEEFSLRNIEEMYLSIGVGDLSLGRLVNHLTVNGKEENYLGAFNKQAENTVTFGDDSISILGLRGLLTTMAKCCKPAPGDEIVGYITRGRGATVHRRDCPNVLRVKDRERLVQVSWGEPKTTYPVAVRIIAYDRDGLMRDVSTVISEEGINMGQVKAHVDNNQAIFDLILEVGDIGQLSRVLTVLESLPNILEARRVNPG